MAASATRFDKFVALATRLIGKNGRAISVNSRGAAAFIDDSQPWLGRTSSATEITTDGVFLTGKELRDLVRNLEISDTFGSIARDSSGLMIAAEGLGATRINVDDTIGDAHRSATWAIRNVEVVEPGAVPILWILEIGK